MNADIKKKIKDLEKAGFKVKRVVSTTKKTFEVSEETLKDFMKTLKSRDILVKDAVDQALTDWIKKNS